jgi:hypothetical protein
VTDNAATAIARMSAGEMGQMLKVVILIIQKVLGSMIRLGRLAVKPPAWTG